MKLKWKSSGNCCCRPGLTLVETTLGLGLLASLLSAMLIAHGKCLRQAKAAERKLQAIAAADELLADWMAIPDGMPTGGSGPFPNQPDLRWRIKSLPSSEASLVSAQAIRFEVFHVDKRTTAENLILSIDMLAPVPKENNSGDSTSVSR